MILPTCIHFHIAYSIYQSLLHFHPFSEILLIKFHAPVGSCDHFISAPCYVSSRLLQEWFLLFGENSFCHCILMRLSFVHVWFFVEWQLLWQKGFFGVHLCLTIQILKLFIEKLYSSILLHIQEAFATCISSCKCKKIIFCI